MRLRKSITAVLFFTALGGLVGSALGQDSGSFGGFMPQSPANTGTQAPVAPPTTSQTAPAPQAAPAARQAPATGRGTAAIPSSAPGPAFSAPVLVPQQSPTSPTITNRSPTNSSATSSPGPQQAGQRGPSTAQPAVGAAPQGQQAEQPALQGQQQLTPPPTPIFDINARNDFQDFVAQSTGRVLPLFGYSLFQGVPSTFAPVDNVPVTPDYVIGPGDTIVIKAWGQIDVDLQVTVDRNGQINIPKVGTLNLSGIKYADLSGFIKSSIGRIYRNFELTVTMGTLRSIQIFVVGNAARPGAYTVSALSTLINALFASGGPSPTGSMRGIQLKRGKEVVAEFDLYELLVYGDKSKDVKLLPGDVVYIPPVGKLAAISGGVNTQAIFELKDKTSFEDLIRLAGGFTTTAQGQKAIVERIVNRIVRRVEEFPLDNTGLARELSDGDVISIASIPQRFDNAVLLQGNVAAPARRPWSEGMRVLDLLGGKEGLIPREYWSRQNAGQFNNRYTVREVDFEYAIVQRLEPGDLTTRQYAFNLGKAIQGDETENIVLRPGDIVRVFGPDESVPKTENDIAVQGSVIGGSLRRFVWRPGSRVTNVLPDISKLVEQYWARRAGGQVNSSYTVREVNFDYALVQRFDSRELVTRQYAFNLGKAMRGDPMENIALQPGDVVTLFSADEALPKTENDVALSGSVVGQRRFVWREGFRIRDIIPDAQWLIDFYDYWGKVKGSVRTEINWDFAQIIRLQPGDLSKVTIPFSLGKAIFQNDPENNIVLKPGDEISIYLKDEIGVSVEKQKILVRLDGEFNTSGTYQVQRGETLRQLASRVGGFTASAYLYGAVFTREATRASQQKNLDEAIARLEREGQRMAAEQIRNTSEPGAVLADQQAQQQVMLAKLRELKASGRIVLELSEDARLKDLPDLPLEDGDRFSVPARPGFVNVVGEVFSQGSFIYRDGKSLTDYVSLAGGQTKDADDSSIYVIRADGTVASAQQSWISIGSKRLMPGDSIVVPERFQRFSLVRSLKDWTQILYQFGLGAAAIRVISRP